MAREKWKLVNDNSLDARYYDAKRYRVSYDPSGNAHFSKRSSGRSRARSVMSDIGFYRNGLLVLILLVALIRFVFFREFGYEDMFFVKYPSAVDAYGNEIDLYYFDVFRFLKYLSQSANLWKSSLVTVFDGLTKSWGDNVVLNIINSLLALVNWILALLKILAVLPLQILAIVFGGPMAQWASPDGWISNFLNWSIPYATAEWYDRFLDNGGGIIINPMPWVG